MLNMAAILCDIPGSISYAVLHVATFFSCMYLFQSIVLRLSHSQKYPPVITIETLGSDERIWCKKLYRLNVWILGKNRVYFFIIPILLSISGAANFHWLIAGTTYSKKTLGCVCWSKATWNSIHKIKPILPHHIPVRLDCKNRIVCHW